MNQQELDDRITRQAARLADRGDRTEEHTHRWGTAYRSSGGRRVCLDCGHVTDKPFETLGVAER